MNSYNQDFYSQDDLQSQDIKLLRLIEEDNIAENLDEDTLTRIGRDAKAGFDADNDSRQEWLDQTLLWLDLAKQARDKKNFPWPDASNVKYPLISTAAMQFSARAYPALVPGNGALVQAMVIGKDPDGSKAEKADRIAKYMSWQFLYDMPCWQEDMDRMLIMLPVYGMMFKKVYYNRELDKVVSELVYPENFVVDYWTTSLENAERFSEILYIPERVVKARQKSGEYLDVDLGSPPQQEEKSNLAQDLVPYKIIQQGTWLDLDEDGLKEPYTVIFHYESAKVLRIIPRFTPSRIKFDSKANLKNIDPICNYIKFSFIPNPDGGFYDLGFGHLLGPLNEAVNSLINQLVDAGTLANLQAGFIGKGLRLKMGETPLKPGEWRAVNAVGDDLRKQIVPLPAKEPSNVLFQLLGSLITSGKELASVAEIFVGKMPGQNTPATTTMATIEQGMKVFTAIYKRLYRSLEQEFKKVFYLNYEYLDQKTYAAVLDQPIDPNDFNKDLYDVCPSADPNTSSKQEELMKAQALLELLPLGTLDPVEVTIRVLKAQDQPNWEKLIPGLAQTGQPQIPQRQDPKMMELQAKMEMEAQKHQLNMAEKQREMEMNQRSKEFELAMKAQEQQLDLQSKLRQAQLDAQIANQQHAIKTREMFRKAQEAAMKDKM